MTPATLAVGVVLLLYGRRAFWLFVASAGFLAGALAVAEVMPGRSDAAALALAIGAGVLGALLALFVQRLAVGVGGFLAGALLGQSLAPLVPGDWPGWLPMIAIGLLGAILLLVLFDSALMVLSTLLGAAVIAQATPVPAPWPTAIFIALVLVGLTFQSRRRDPPPKKETRQRD
jgi:hypothetical protein